MNLWTRKMDAHQIILKYYRNNKPAYDLLVSHSEAVCKKALEIAELNKNKNPDMDFIVEASLLHDIGVFKTNVPAIHCFGEYPYLAHGFLGRELIENEGFPKHALVCERHIGVGITREEIIKNKLPIPKRDIIPMSLEEKIISVADKFYSKSKGLIPQSKSIDEIVLKLDKKHSGKGKRFLELLEELNLR